MAGCGTVADYGRAILLAAVMFSVGYLTGANAPTPLLSRGNAASWQLTSMAIQPAAQPTAPQTTIGQAADAPVEQLPKSALCTSPMIESGPTPYALVGLYQQLGCIRAAVTLYAMQHMDVYPTLKQLQDDWKILTQVTDSRGNPTAVKLAGWGPYLNEPPINPVMRSTKISLIGRVEADSGWVYDPVTGRVNAVLPHGVRWRKFERWGTEYEASIDATTDIR